MTNSTEPLEPAKDDFPETWDDLGERPLDESKSRLVSPTSRFTSRPPRTAKGALMSAVIPEDPSTPDPDGDPVPPQNPVEPPMEDPTPPLPTPDPELPPEHRPQPIIDPVPPGAPG